MKRLAVVISVSGFFILAVVGWACGLQTHTCAIKSAVGAVGLYVLLRFAGGFAVDIVAGGIAESVRRQQNVKDSTFERGNQ